MVRQLIETIPIDALERGAVVSVIELDWPVIETFTNGTENLSMVFLAGLPMTYSVFCAQFLAQFSSRAKDALGKRLDGSTVLLSELDASAHHRFWGNMKLPSEIRAVIAMKEGNASSIVAAVVGELYKRYTMKSEELDEKVKMFKDLIRRIDEAYGESLVDPVQI